MLKKIFYIILILAVIGGGIYAWFYFSKKAPQNNQTASLPEVSTSGTSQPASSAQSSYSITDTFPKTDTISIGTSNGSVEIKNFYKNIIDTEEGHVILADSADYQISYDRNTSIFYINLISAAAQQSKAENQLLGILGVGQQDICKLNVVVLKPGQTNGGRLSFCAGVIK